MVTRTFENEFQMQARLTLEDMDPYQGLVMLRVKLEPGNGLLALTPKEEAELLNLLKVREACRNTVKREPYDPS